MIIKMPLIPGGKTGKVGKISVLSGDSVVKDTVLVQVETAKGNRVIKAPFDAIICSVLCEEGAEVLSNAELFDLIDKNASDGEVAACLKRSPSKELETDLLVIGGGPGGYVAAIYAAKNGLDVTLVEREELGGTCLNVGCIPTKALVKSAEVCREIKEASLFGVEVEKNPIVNMKRVIERKNEVTSRLVSGIDFLMKKNSITVIRGNAEFSDSKIVAVNGSNPCSIKAKNIIIATGSKVSTPRIDGIELPFVMDSTAALSLTDLPQSIAIIGGGVIGMEFAFIYSNFGVKVYVVEFMDRVLSMLDKDISDEIMRIAIEKGISIQTGSKVSKITKSFDGQAVVVFDEQGKENILVCDRVLSAVGRMPNTDKLGLEKSGVELNDNGKGIKVNSQMRTNVENIHAIGDVTNIIQLAHVASHQAIVAVDDILGKNVKMDYSAVPNVIFTSPEIASVGICEDEARAKGIDISVSRFDFSANGKALTMSEPDGFIKLVKSNESGKIIGGTIIGADASSLISTLTIAIKNGFSDKEITETIFAHPTTAEVIHEAALGFGLGAIHA